MKSMIVIILACAAMLANAGDLPIGTFADGAADGWTFNLGKEFPGAQGNFAILKDNGYAAYLEGAFGVGGNYVSMEKTLAKPVPFKTLRFKTRTSGVEFLTVRLTDATGQVHQQRIPVKESPAWQTIEVKDYKGESYTNFEGAKDGQWHDPLRSVSILVTKAGLDGAKFGNALFSDIVLTVGGGLFEQPQNYAVYQRQADNAAEIPVVIRYAPGIKSLAWRQRSGDAWQPLDIQHAVVRLPAGGWYRLEFKLENQAGESSETVVEQVGVGEVFITAGQSNSGNWGEPRQKTATGMVSVFDGKSWRPAVDPLPICDGVMGSVWPLVGDRLATELKMPVGFLCVGVGGSGVAQWTPENYRDKVKDKQFYGRFAKYVPLLKPYGCRALLWHQGETDRLGPEDVYYVALKNIIADFKKDFGDIPWLVAVVGNSWMAPDSGVGCRAAQQRIIAEGVALRGPDTDAIGKEFRLKSGQSSHFNQQGLETHAALWCDAVNKGLLHERQ